MECLLQSFDIWGEPWGKFSDWLRGNVVARWLMFPSVYCTRAVIQDAFVAFYTNNQCETTNRRVKDELDIIRKGRSTGDIVTVIDVCHKLDIRDSRNMKRFSIGGRRPSYGKPKWEIQQAEIRKLKRKRELHKDTSAENTEGKRSKKAKTAKKPKRAARLEQKVSTQPTGQEMGKMISLLDSFNKRMLAQEELQGEQLDLQRRAIEVQQKEIEFRQKEMEARLAQVEKSMDKHDVVSFAERQSQNEDVSTPKKSLVRKITFSAE